MTDRTDAIKAAIDATAPSELRWLPNPGREPEIPQHHRPKRRYAGALVIAGKLNAVGENFAGITSGNQQITLSINTDQARWLGRYVGGEVKLTLEVTP